MMTQKTSRISQALKKYGRFTRTHRTEVDILKIAFFGVAVSALTNFLTFGINSDLTDAFAWANIMKWALILTLMFVSFAALMCFFVWLLKRRTRDTAELRANVVKAIRQALDQSSFNPHLNKHERINK
jgi:lysylphosphatidylglycerol synthetase-like protein (DUF2156 family)